MKPICIWTKQWLSENKIPFCFFEQSASSNDLAKQKAFQNLSSPTVFLVKKQTKGRGSGNKKWKNSDLMLSFLWEKNLKKIHSSHCRDFTEDLRQALKKTWPDLTLFVKAPNDLYMSEGKVAGLLMEVLSQGAQTALIVGLGLNVFACPKNLKADYLYRQAKDIDKVKWKFFLDQLIFLWRQRASF